MPATIQVGSKPLGGGVEHMYLLYTNEAGETRVLRGGPEGSSFTNAMFGDIEVLDRAYRQNDPENNFMDPPDWDSDHTHTVKEIFSGTDAEMYAKIELAHAEMNRINLEGYDYNLPVVDSLIQGWGGANDQNSNTVVTSLSDVMSLKSQVLNFISEKELHVPGYDATLEHSSFERTEQTLYQGLKDSGHQVSDLFFATKEVVGNFVDDSKNFFANLFGREAEAQQSQYVPSQINNSLLDFTSAINAFSNNALINPDGFLTGSALHGGDYSADMPIDILNGDGFFNTSVSEMVSNWYKPGAQELAEVDFANTLDRQLSINVGAYEYYNNVSIYDSVPEYIPSYDSVDFLSSVSNISLLYNSAPDIRMVDPLVLDLNGDGVGLISYEDSKASFDVDNDGLIENTGWVKGTDGILVHDRNGDSIINNITETISEYYGTAEGSSEKKFADGLDALRSFDSNKDGVFDNQDAMWSELKVWQDANENGKTDAGELKTLDELNIASIDLDREAIYRERLEGNPVLSRSTMQLTDGTTREVAAVATERTLGILSAHVLRSFSEAGSEGKKMKSTAANDNFINMRLAI